jgi:hypothetical protein
LSADSIVRVAPDIPVHSMLAQALSNDQVGKDWFILLSEVALSADIEKDRWDWDCDCFGWKATLFCDNVSAAGAKAERIPRWRIEAAAKLRSEVWYIFIDVTRTGKCMKSYLFMVKMGKVDLCEVSDTCRSSSLLSLADFFMTIMASASPSTTSFEDVPMQITRFSAANAYKNVTQHQLNHSRLSISVCP